MAKTAVAVAVAADPVADRVAVLERVRSRRPPEAVATYPNVAGGAPMTVRAPAAVDRVPPADLGEWADDRVLAAFGGRTRLNPAEGAAFAVLGAFRSGDPAAVRRAVSEAGAGLDDRLRHLVHRQLEEWRSGAPGYAIEVTGAAAAEGRRLGWDRRPRRRSRAPEPLSQLPGDRAAV